MNNKLINNIETTVHGSMIVRSVDMFSSKMDYHFRFLNQENWTSINVDTSYLGYWFNEKTMQIFSFCEGSIVEYTCIGIKAFSAELLSVRNFIKNNL